MNIWTQEYENGEGSRFYSIRLSDFTITNFIICIFHLNMVRVTKSIILRWAGRVARMEEFSSALNILTGRPIGKSPPVRLMHR